MSHVEASTHHRTVGNLQLRRNALHGVWVVSWIDWPSHRPQRARYCHLAWHDGSKAAGAVAEWLKNLSLTQRSQTACAWGVSKAASGHPGVDGYATLIRAGKVKVVRKRSGRPTSVTLLPIQISSLSYWLWEWPLTFSKVMSTMGPYYILGTENVLWMSRFWKINLRLQIVLPQTESICRECACDPILQWYPFADRSSRLLMILLWAAFVTEIRNLVSHVNPWNTHYSLSDWEYECGFKQLLADTCRVLTRKWIMNRRSRAEKVFLTLAD